MPKENRFAGLGEAMESTPGDEEDEFVEAEDTEEAEHGTEETETGHGAEETEHETEGASTAEAASTTETASTSETTAGDTDATPPEGGVAESTATTDDDRSTGSDRTTVDSDAGSDEEDGSASEGSQAEEKQVESVDEDGGPAFEFEATTAKSIYVRTETLDQMDDAEFEVESRLRREHDIRDLTGREFHDALVRIAATYPDEIADAIVRTRDE
ncbi:hypothetical protein [Haloferax profundi]|uniref:Uncharacterized protein n=1 Tax=Haloferax profundi TaxID=1544718 RepID=A0A0W1SKG7_9EURY|nr:hypothetical protein [Haloferax profundi]KTG26673.1 hypothetical protein AUR66_15945 [Haloferax profundi]